MIRVNAILGVALVVALEALAAAAEVRVVLEQLETVNVSPAAREDLWRLFQRRIAVLGGVRQVKAVATLPSESCLTRLPCRRRFAQRVDAHRLLGLSVGGMSQTYILRLTSRGLTGAAGDGRFQQTVRDLSPAVVAPALDRMLRSAIPLRKTAVSPWYGKWWVWTAAAAIVGGSVTAVALLSRDSSDPEFVIRPP